MMFSFLVALSILLLLRFRTDRKRSSLYFILSSVAFALAILTKGPPALLFWPPALILFLWRDKGLRQLRNPWLLLAIPLVAAILAPWPLLVIRRCGWDRCWKIFFEETYHLTQVQISCGNHSIPTATVCIQGANGQVFCDADHGTGPVDAVYRAINRVIGEPNELIEFSIQAVTEGMDAVGRVTIRIQADEAVKDNGVERRIFSGRGSDTDIIVASAKAYMFALNQLIAARREAGG